MYIYNTTYFFSYIYIIIVQSIFLFILLLIPVSVFAEDSLGTFNFDPSKISHPYDMVNSKGEVIKYEDYSKNSLIRINETPSIEGSGKINPVYLGDKLEIPNDFSNFSPPSYIIDDTWRPHGAFYFLHPVNKKRALMLRTLS